jgi:hypothetical protein
MPTANVAIKESAKVSVLTLSAWMLRLPTTCKNSPERWNGLSPKLVPEVWRDRVDTRRPGNDEESFTEAEAHGILGTAVSLTSNSLSLLAYQNSIAAKAVVASSGKDATRL